MTQRRPALAALLATVLAPAASLPAEAPRAGAAVPAETALVPAGLGPAAGCDAQSMLPDPGPVGAAEANCVAPDLERDQAYLVETARPARTMLQQGLALAIVRLHPMFVRRLAGAIGEVRAAGLPSAGIFSAYRPPAFGVGGFSDEFSSLHTYGLAVDMLGVGGPGSSEAKLWYEIAARHGIVCPYGAASRREWNHCQPTGVKSIMAGDPLRGTVSPQGPIDREAMFALGNALFDAPDAGAWAPELQPPIDERWLSRNEGPPRPQRAAIPAEAIKAARERADPSHDTGRAKSVAGSLPAHDLGPRIVAENASVKSAPVKNYRTASLVRRDSLVAVHPASSKQNMAGEHARLDRLVKSVCRGC